MQEEEFEGSWAEFDDASSFCYDLPFDYAVHGGRLVFIVCLLFVFIALSDLELKIKASMAVASMHTSL